MAEKSFVPTTGTTFCGYELIAPVGKGGMGAVWTATNPGGVLVAVKFMLDTAAQQTEMRAEERFRREAEVLHAATHDPDEPGKRAPWASDHLVPIIDAFNIEEFGGVGCIVMPVIPGYSLQAIIKGTAPYTLSALSTRDKLTIILHIADALTSVHGANFMHRDVKPLNVMVYINPRTLKVTAWLLDCGIALPIDHTEADRYSAVGDVLGSFAYLSPEYIRSNARTCTPKGDAFSLAMLAYILFSGGRHPYDLTGQDDNTMIATNIWGGKRASSAISGIYPRIRELIEAGLKDEPKKRAEVSDIIHAIVALLRDHELSFDVPAVPVAAQELEPEEEEPARVLRPTAPPSPAVPAAALPAHWAPPPIQEVPYLPTVHIRPSAQSLPLWVLVVMVAFAAVIITAVFGALVLKPLLQPRSQTIPPAATMMAAGAPPLPANPASSAARH